MLIRSTLQELMAERGIENLNELSRQSGVTYPTLLSLYHKRAKGITFPVLDALCRTLKCEVGDLIEYTAKRGR